MFTYLLLLSLLSCLVEVHSLTEYPYVSFMGETLPNHTYVNLSLVGESSSGSLQCHTDLVTCCGMSQGIHRGDWFFPNEERLPLFTAGDPDISETRGAQRVDLRRKNNANMPSGIYRCDIPTNAVYNDGDISMRESVYVGLYASGGISEMKLLTYTILNYNDAHVNVDNDNPCDSQNLPSCV